MSEDRQKMHKFLLDTISQIINFDEETEEFIIKSFRELKIKKGDHFLKEGEPNLLLGFIVKGLVRIYITKNGDEQSCIDFSKEGEFITVYDSFLQNGISTQSIQAIEDTSLLVINNNDLQYFYQNIPNGDRLGRILIEKRFIELAGQLYSNYLHNSEQRYLHFVKTYPDLLQRIPQYHISSFVGIKPQSLSRIRKRLARG
jgi:CRP-like cAMP-binding protein